MRTGSSVRSSGFGALGLHHGARGGLLAARLRLVRLGLLLALAVLGLVVVDDVDAHLREHGVDVLDLLGGHFFRGITAFSSSWSHSRASSRA
jgi:hypothetical protein